MTGKEKILQFLVRNGPATDELMAEKIGMNPSSIRTRRHELEMEGIVVAVGKKLTKSGRQTWLWAVLE